MREILLPESVAAVFLVVYFTRPFIKRLWPLDGLVWLPPLSLAITVALFPAYGFRPECIPLLLFQINVNIRNIPLLASSLAASPNNAYRDTDLLKILRTWALLLASLAVMFVFSPLIPPDQDETPVETTKIRDETRNLEYFLRVYGPSETGGPLIFLIPPEFGSIHAVDLICTELGERGFRVIAYSRRGFDFIASGENKRPYFVSPGQLHVMWRAFQAGTRLKKANEQGKALEQERLRDIEFLLPRLPALTGQSSGTAPLVLAGWGAGGSAALLLASQADFPRRFPAVKGVALVESRLWSAYFDTPLFLPESPDTAAWYSRVTTAFLNRLRRLQPQKVTGFGPVPRPTVPVLGLVSDRAFTNTKSGPYKALLETLRDADTAVLAAVKGAGPLDYTGYPWSRPLYTFFFPGSDKTAVKSANPIAATADIITTFAALLPGVDAATLKKEPVNAELYIESRGLPDF